MTKTEINKFLKTLGLETIKMSVNMYQEKTWKPDGTLVKGILLASHSPMDCFPKKIDQKKAQIFYELEMAGLDKMPGWSDTDFKIKETSKTIEYLSFETVSAPTYYGKLRDYTSTYLVPYFHKVKKNSL